MTKTVNLSITVETGKEKIKEIKISIRSDHFEEDMKKVQEKVTETVGMASLSAYDESLRREEMKGIKTIGTQKREIEIQTGKLMYKRRVYRMVDGTIKKPLDDLLGYEKYQRRSWRSQEQICVLASDLTYQKAAEINSRLTERLSSAATVSRDIKRVGERIEEQEMQFAADEPGQIKSPVLYAESDGIWIPVQRTVQSKVEVKVAIVYTGKKTISGGRKRLENKLTDTSLGLSVSAWQERIRERTYSHSTWIRRNCWLLEGMEELGLVQVLT